MAISALLTRHVCQFIHVPSQNYWIKSSEAAESIFVENRLRRLLPIFFESFPFLCIQIHDSCQTSTVQKEYQIWMCRCLASHLRFQSKSFTLANTLGCALKQIHY